MHEHPGSNNLPDLPTQIRHEVICFSSPDAQLSSTHLAPREVVGCVVAEGGGGPRGNDQEGKTAPVLVLGQTNGRRGEDYRSERSIYAILNGRNDQGRHRTLRIFTQAA